MLKISCLRRLCVLSGLLAIGLNTGSVRGESDIIPYGASWLYLAPNGFDEQPDLTDVDFEDTWFLPNYNTSSPLAWEGPAPEPIGYGAINGFTNGFATTLDTPADGERFSVYFRHNFTTTQEYSGLAFEYLLDDGAKIYLDGNEILSINCCQVAQDGEIAFWDEFSTAVGDEDNYAFQTLALDKLTAGNHVLAVGLHQQAASSSDIGFSLRLIEGYSPPVYEEIFPTGESFKFFQGYEEPSNGDLSWTTQAFNDNSWEVGQEGFGYESSGAGGVVPLLNTPIDEMNGAYVSLYLRKEFAVPDPTKFGELSLSIDYDDAFIAYINGREVHNQGITDADGDPTTAIPFDIDAADVAGHESTNGSGAPGQEFRIDLKNFPGLLKAGDNNILAIHGVNDGLTSSDFVLAQISLSGILGDGGGGILGDFDNSGSLDTADIDALNTEIRNGTNNGLYDVTNDGRVDSSDRDEWVHVLKNTYYGDADLNGEFQSTDFVTVFLAGKYESGEAAGWGEGDWNGDNAFGSSDFVTAFLDGGYETGPRQGVSAVPEPSSALLLLLGLVGFVRRRR